MSAVTKDLLRQVERVAIAPLRRIEAARPKGYVHTNYAAWKPWPLATIRHERTLKKSSGS